MTAIKAVLFDLGGTLIKTAPVTVGFKRILTRHGIQMYRDIDEAECKKINNQMTRYHGLPYREFWRISNIKILKKIGVSENLEELADAVSDEWWDNVDLELYPEVKGTLTMLQKQGLKIGMVTNGFRKDIEDILLRVGLTDNFDITVGIDDVGKPKPDKKIFLYALEKLTVEPHETLFVGDNIDIDYKGAERAGLKPLLIDREDRVKGNYKKIRNLKEVVPFLQNFK
jgi:putative hydrolase of the HAD superfamily